MTDYSHHCSADELVRLWACNGKQPTTAIAIGNTPGEKAHWAKDIRPSAAQQEVAIGAAQHSRAAQAAKERRAKAAREEKKLRAKAKRDENKRKATAEREETKRHKGKKSSVQLDDVADDVAEEVVDGSAPCNAGCPLSATHPKKRHRSLAAPTVETDKQHCIVVGDELQQANAAVICSPSIRMT
eukprot:jgi/Chrzof1/6175/Cz17g14100.t1